MAGAAFSAAVRAADPFGAPAGVDDSVFAAVMSALTCSRSSHYTLCIHPDTGQLCLPFIEQQSLLTAG